MRAITLKEALTIIEGALTHAAKKKLKPLTAVVLDAGGRVKAVQKQDGCSLMRVEIAHGKAFAALALGRSSKLALQKQREKPVFMDNLISMISEPFFLEGGGQLIYDETGEVVGAVGLTGDRNEKDDECAIAGIRAAGFEPDAVQYDGPGDGPRAKTRTLAKAKKK
jgi:uncharacterized protein GlcG (DUF336 family)